MVSACSFCRTTKKNHAGISTIRVGIQLLGNAREKKKIKKIEQWKSDCKTLENLIT